MKHLLTLLLPLILSIAATAQNIVPNYSFEETDSCPTMLRATFYEYAPVCVGWGQATPANPDYFNTCDTSAASVGQRFPIAGVPYNNLGHQAAYQGNAYAGFYMYDDGFDYKEYLIAAIPALEIDTAYKVSIEVSLADSCKYATDAIGVLFTTYGCPDPYTYGTLPAVPQIDYTSYGVITDTMNWVTLSAMFIADSGYTNVIIGGFKEDADMHITTFNNLVLHPHLTSYYYIDNVVVEKLSTTGLKSVKTNVPSPKLYPNPVTDHSILLFNNSGNENYTLMVYDMQGQAVAEKSDITTGRVTIERNNLPTGVYYYQLRSAGNASMNGKFIIR